MKTNLLLWLLVIGGINLFVPGQLFFILMIIVVAVFTPFDKARNYTSSYWTLLPFLLLVILGIARGLVHANYFYRDFYKDFYRDFFIFFKNIIYFIGGIALSKYIKNFNAFFRYFLILAFASSLLHMGLILTHLQSISSLETIRYVAGYANGVEGLAFSIFLSRIFSKSFGSLTEPLNAKEKLMMLVISISFLLYFSRTLIVLAVVVSFFLTDTIYIRKIFSKKNVKIFNAFILISVILFLVSLMSSLLPPDSPFKTLVSKFENIPEEVSWNAKKNEVATRTEIQDNWRGYEAYQGLLKFYKGDEVKKSLGYGFGERIDLGIIMKLAGEDYDTVPILHNQYVTLLVKCGIVGFALYLFFLYKMGCSKIKYHKDDYPELYYSFQMLSALSIVSLLNTYIGFGLLNTTNVAIPLVLGFFWGNIQRHKNSSKYIQTRKINA